MTISYYCHSGTWLFTMLKTVWLSIAFLVCFLNPRVLSKSNLTCYEYGLYPNGPSFQYDSYQLFATKTTYMTARKEIRKHVNSEWPTEIEQCSPVYLYLLSRHAIRYPKETEITELRSFLSTFKKELMASNFLDKRLFVSMLNWKFKMNETDDNHVSQSGSRETGYVASIFNNYFPSFFDLHNITFDVGVSAKIRTTETADAFINSLLVERLSDSANTWNELIRQANAIKKSKFQKHYKSILMSHKTCKSLIKKKLPKSPDYAKIIDSQSVKQLLASFSKRNGLKYTISYDSLFMVYKTCSYESAIYNFSPWCHLFNYPELQTIEFVLDIEEYHDAHAHEPHRKLACNVVNDLQLKLKSIIEQGHFAQNTTLYFSHENLMSKLFSFFGLFKSFPNIEQYYDSSRNRFCIPNDREWQSSVVVPFGTNFAAVLYKCDQSFKLFTLVNEVPVVVRGCNNSLCNIEDFFREYQPHLTECDLNKICKIQ